VLLRALDRRHEDERNRNRGDEQSGRFDHWIEEVLYRRACGGCNSRLSAR
jgi:hypothetical protein